jgi:hypothetical protein
MTDDDHVHEEPGPRAQKKLGDTSEPGHPQPEAAEVESARLLANQARDALEAQGLQKDKIRALADEYVALDLGEDIDEFMDWAMTHGRRERGTG